MKKKSFLFLAALLVFSVFINQTEIYAAAPSVRAVSDNYTIKSVLDNGYIFAVDKQERGGFLSKAGEPLTPFIYGSFSDFRYYPSYDLISLSANGLFGVLTGNLTEAVPFIFDEPIDLGPDFFIACYSGYYGIIGSNGNPVTSFTYDNIFRTIDDNTFKVIERGLYGLVSSTGKYLVPTAYAWLGRLSDNGLIPFLKDGNIGYIDTSDNVVIPNIFTDATHFSNKYASFFKDGKWGVISRTGTTVAEAKYDEPLFFDTNGIAVYKTDKKAGLINSSGAELTLAGYESIDSGASALYIAKEYAQDSSGKYLLIGSNGKAVNDKKYDSLDLLSAGSAKNPVYSAEINGKFALLNSYGNEITQFVYDSITETGEYFSAQKQDSTDLLDNSGRTVLSGNYEGISGPYGGVFIVKNSDKYGLVNTSGFSVLKAEYDVLQPFNGRYALCEKNGKAMVIELSDYSPVIKLKINSKAIVIDNFSRIIDAPLYIENGRTMIPTKWLSVALGLPANSLSWNAASETATLKNGSILISVKKGSNILSVNGSNIVMDAPATIKHDRMYIPVKYFADALSIRYSWDDTSKTVTFYYFGNKI